MTSVDQAKQALDSLIAKARVHLYKPIQIAEILYRNRLTPDSLDLLNLELYRTKSKQWRDEISTVLLGTRSTSSSRFQDDLFNQNAIPPEVLNVLGEENRRTGGAVEAYIYSRFSQKYDQLSMVLSYITHSSKEDFDIATLLSSFRSEAGLKRSIDKIYEIVVFSLFSTLLEILNVSVNVQIDPERIQLLEEFSDFTRLVMGLDPDDSFGVQKARVFRVGATNAADRGLDMYSNWGPAIQIKHLTLDESMAESIVTSVSSDRIVIVCRDVDQGVIVSLLNQIGWKARIQSVITEGQLIDWYQKALRGAYKDLLGDGLLDSLRSEILIEFPSVGELPLILSRRKYHLLSDDYWISASNSRAN